MRQLSLFDLDVLKETTGSAVPDPAKVAVSRAPAVVAGATAEGLERRLGQLLKGGLKALVLTDNRTRIISARSTSGGLEVRIHHCFVEAPPDTLKYVAEFVNGARGSARQHALDVIREHFERYRKPAPKRRRRLLLEPVGRYFDLEEIRDDLNERFFDSGLDIHITWGREAATRRRRRGQGYSMRLGSYHAPERLIRVHRGLDRADVPRHVVESVVYHEMLHAVVPPIERRGQRRQIHPPEFRRREREFPHYQAAEDWLEKNLGRLAKPCGAGPD